MAAAGPRGLEAMLIRPAGTKRYPLALISHGSPRDAKAREGMAPNGLYAQAIEFARRGFAAVVVMRRGYGNSDGSYAENSGPCARRDYMIGMENTGTAVVDDPDQQLYESYSCDSDRNFTGYCNRALEERFRQQSAETDQEKRKALVWDIDAELQEEGARPVIFHTRGATCWHPRLKDLTTMVNSMYNGWRLDDVWLEK